MPQKANFVPLFAAADAKWQPAEFGHWLRSDESCLDHVLSSLPGGRDTLDNLVCSTKS